MNSSLYSLQRSMSHETSNAETSGKLWPHRGLQVRPLSLACGHRLRDYSACILSFGRASAWKALEEVTLKDLEPQ